MKDLVNKNMEPQTGPSDIQILTVKNKLLIDVQSNIEWNNQSWLIWIITKSLNIQ